MSCNAGRVKDAFDEAADVADESKDAAESGAGSTAIRSSETAAYIVLAAGLRYQDNTQAAYSAAVDAGLSAQRVSFITFMTSSCQAIFATVDNETSIGRNDLTCLAE